MQILTYIFIASAIIFFIIKLCFAMRGGKAILRLLLHSALGLAVLTAVNLTCPFSGVHIPINEWSVSSAAAFGMPAVCGLLILQLLF